MKRKPSVAAILSLALLAAAAVGAWYLLGRRPAAVCPLSGREIHTQTKARVVIGGSRYETCCLRCAITEARQKAEPLRVLEVADFETGKLMRPDRAWFVDGSPVNLCMRMSPAAESPDRQGAYLRGFDRCEPSVLAFSNEQQARNFIAQHGGALKNLADLEREIKSVPSE